MENIRGKINMNVNNDIWDAVEDKMKPYKESSDNIFDDCYFKSPLWSNINDNIGDIIIATMRIINYI